MRRTTSPAEMRSIGRPRELRDQPAALRAQLLYAGIVELPLAADIALLAVGIPDLPSDPADRFIVATAIGRRYAGNRRFPIAALAERG